MAELIVTNGVEYNDMTWLYYIGISVVLYSFSVTLQRILLKDQNNSPIAFSILYQLIVGILVGIAGLLFSDFQIPASIKEIIPNLILMVLFYGFSNVFIFSSLKNTEVSIFTVLFSTRALFTTLASSLILDETLDSRQLTGLFLILLSVAFLNLQGNKFKIGKGEIFALLGALLFGLANTNDRFLLQNMDLYPYVTLAFIAPAIFIAGVYPKEIVKIKGILNTKTLGKLLLLCGIYATSAVTFFIALQSGTNSSQISAINLSSVILTVLLGILFLGERTNLLKKIVCAIISFAGLLLLI